MKGGRRIGEGAAVMALASIPGFFAPSLWDHHRPWSIALWTIMALVVVLGLVVMLPSAKSGPSPIPQGVFAGTIRNTGQIIGQQVVVAENIQNLGFIGDVNQSSVPPNESIASKDSIERTPSSVHGLLAQQRRRVDRLLSERPSSEHAFLQWRNAAGRWEAETSEFISSRISKKDCDAFARIDLPHDSAALSRLGEPFNDEHDGWRVRLLRLRANLDSVAKRQRFDGEWTSKVTEVTPSGELPGFWNLLFRLYPPDSEPRSEEVRCTLQFGGETFQPKAGQLRWTDVNLQPGESPHYLVFYFTQPGGASFFEGAPSRLRDGDYVLRWTEGHALGWSEVTEPHSFSIANGRLLGATVEDQATPGD